MVKAVSIHVHEVSELGEPSQEFNERINKGISLLKEIVNNGENAILIGNCGPACKIGGGYIKIYQRPYHAEIVRNEAIRQGIPKKDIYTQIISLDTVGEAFFQLPLILLPLGIENLEIVSSNYHIPRIRIIYEKIYDEKYTINFHGVNVENDSNKRILEHEKESTKLFMEQFGNIPKGDLTNIEKMLYDKHGLYNTYPENQKLKFFS